MEICCAANLLGITAIIVLLVVVLLRKKKEEYCLSEEKSLLGGGSTQAAKTYVFSPKKNTEVQHFYSSNIGSNTYALNGVTRFPWIGVNNIAISNVKPTSEFIEGKLGDKDRLYFDNMDFAVIMYNGEPNLLRELQDLRRQGPIYLYSL